jgi:hypothetical protein
MGIRLNQRLTRLMVIATGIGMILFGLLLPWN